MQNTKRFIVWAIIIAFVLTVPLATQFTNEIQWNETVAYITILLAVGGTYETWRLLKARSFTYRLAFGIGLAGLFLLGWVSGAVGIIGSENNSVNVMYWAIPAVGLIGSFISCFKSRKMAYTLFTMAVIQLLIPIVALILSPEVSWGNAGVIGVFIFNSIFALLFVISAFLFLHKSSK